MPSLEDVRLALAQNRGADIPAPPFLGPDARDAVVLIPLELRGPEIVAYAFVRATGLRDHAGEVSFPGGKVEPGESFEEAVLREVEEEAGLLAPDVQILGQLSPVPVVTGRFLIHPFVAAVARAPRITSAEHAELLEVRLARWLEEGEVIDTAEAPWRGLPLVVPHFSLGERVLYGASAVILFELLSRLAGRALPTRLVKEKPWGRRYEREESGR